MIASNPGSYFDQISTNNVGAYYGSKYLVQYIIISKNL